MPAAPIPQQNYSTGSSAPFQLNSKPNSSRQRKLQSCKSKKANHPGWEIMLLGPTVDTFEARVDCQANELTLTRRRERAVQDRPCTLLHGPIERFLYRPPREHCYDWCNRSRANSLWAILTGAANIQQYSVHTYILAIDLHSPTLCWAVSPQTNGLFHIFS